ncbi:MAG: thiolase family protein [bacterium]|nr:thiolase family protein [bacterium]
MKDVYLVDGVRTPFGNFGGALKDLDAPALGTIVVSELLGRHASAREAIDQVIMGACGQGSEAPNLSRVVALKAGIPLEKPAYTVHRNCGSGLQAIINAHQEILVGEAELVLAGGIESMSSYPYINRDMRWGKRIKHSEFIDSMWEGLTDPVCGQLMGLTAENLAVEFGISREEQDAYAVQSHKKAFRAARTGVFGEESMTVMVPKKAAGRDVPPEPVGTDEGPNPAISAQMLAAYPTIFKKGGSVTPGNACPTNDGAVALYVASGERADALGLPKLARIVSYASYGVEPERMGIGPALAIPKALAKAGLTLDDIAVFEINEAFAAQVLSVVKKLGIDPDKLNPNGGAIALGHPVGASGARLALTLGKELQRRGARYGVASLCIGGGQGIAMVLENPAAS